MAEPVAEAGKNSEAVEDVENVIEAEETPRKDYFCEVCQLHTKNQQGLSIHLKSKKHAMNKRQVDEPSESRETRKKKTPAPVPAPVPEKVADQVPAHVKYNCFSCGFIVFLRGPWSRDFRGPRPPNIFISWGTRCRVSHIRSCCSILHLVQLDAED